MRQIRAIQSIAPRQVIQNPWNLSALRVKLVRQWNWGVELEQSVAAIYTSYSANVKNSPVIPPCAFAPESNQILEMICPTCQLTTAAGKCFTCGVVHECFDMLLRSCVSSQRFYWYNLVIVIIITISPEKILLGCRAFPCAKQKPLHEAVCILSTEKL